jgi:ubiquinone/menaquinone biosynthesis C-methylase UbiE
MQKSVTRPKRILEIGYGGRPFHIEIDQFREVIPQNIEYHGVDFISINSKGGELARLFGDEHKRAMKYMEENPKPKIKLYDEDARNLDPDKFPAASFDEVHMHWVHTDPRVKTKDVKKMLMQIERVLTKEGVVIMSGEVEPEIESRILRIIMQGLSTTPSKEVERWMSKLGFDMKRITNREAAQNIDKIKKMKEEIQREIEKTVFGRWIYRSAEEYAQDTIEFMIFKR